MTTEFPRDPYTDNSFGDPVRFAPWDYRPDAGWAAEFDLVGYHIEAEDGAIGKVVEATHAMGASHLLVETGPWIFGQKVLVPAGTVTHIDHTDRRIYLDRTKDQVKSAPDYDPDQFDDPVYRDKIGAYYGDTYRTL